MIIEHKSNHLRKYWYCEEGNIKNVLGSEEVRVSNLDVIRNVLRSRDTELRLSSITDNGH